VPADEVTHGTDVEGSRVRTGPRHAAPRKPLFTRFQMPAGKAIAIAAMPTAVLMGMGFTPTLAQADDHSTSKSLTAEEYQACVEAVTGEDGVRLATELKPDLILMDIQLPGIDGIEALRRLRANPETAKISAVAVTASVMQQDRKHIMEAGFDGYLGKPISLKELLETVRRMLESR